MCPHVIALPVRCHGVESEEGGGGTDNWGARRPQGSYNSTVIDNRMLGIAVEIL